jgi:signal transduction histidine kinase/CheY-like chemotaxis protein
MDASVDITESDSAWIEIEDKIRPSWNWTQALPDNEHVRFLKSVDWSKTHVGRIADWPPALRQATYQVIADTRPATLYWYVTISCSSCHHLTDSRGTEYVPIYNAAFVPLAGATHPTLMGSTFKKGFPELWQGISPMFELAIKTGIAADVVEAPMTVERNGYHEETFFTGNFTPIRDSEGQIVGFYNALFEVTKQKVSDRRMAVLDMIARPTDLTIENVNRHIMQCLETNECDVTMAMMYQIDTEDENQSILHLCGHTGVPDGHPLLVDNQSWTSSEGLIPLCRYARLRGTPITIPADEKFKDITWRGPGGPSNSVAIITLSNGTQLLGFLIIGTNPRLRDEVNAQFLEDMGRMVSGVLISAVSITQSRLRQERLERDLANSDMKIQHLVQHATVGMVHFSRSGKMIWANKQYYSIAGQDPGDGQNDYSFFENVLEADLPKAEEAWQQVLDGIENVSAEIRLNRLYMPPVGDPVPATGLVNAFPYCEDEAVTSLLACITDISRLKWAENWQTRLAQDAQESKRQQESFIDIVSHEMRNPLSAIVHCVDSIISAVDDCRILGTVPTNCEDALVESLAAARTIELCAKYQRYIIDSVLTLGRMESALLSVTPNLFLIDELCKSIIAMFKNEMDANGISAAFLPHVSYSQLDVKEVLADTSRITQIIINLLTNAIKFVKTEPRRQIRIKLGACTSSPRSMFPPDTQWAPKGDQATDVTEKENWGEGEQIYLTFSVKDTGIGVEEEQRFRIFERFQKASVKTHISYGGAGLGLFVSKQLAEIQGGEIGVRSLPGQGSTFVFYIRVRRGVEALVEALEHHPIQLLSNTTLAILPMLFPEIKAPKSVRMEKAIHVLLVEDNIINQKLLQKQLQRYGCVMHTANHGAEALEKLKGMNCYSGHEKNGIRLDIILMDSEMPVMGGVECTKEIRRLQAEGTICRHVPIIAVTANARREQMEESMAAGTVS